MSYKNNQGAALILDDSPYEVVPLARMLRYYTGLRVDYFPSIPKAERVWEEKLGIPDDGIIDYFIKLWSKILPKYDLIIIDNNFEDGQHEKKSDGWVRGLDFIQGTLMRALELLSPEERPLIICFAPSNEEVIRRNEQSLWEGGVLSFHKYNVEF